VKDNNIDFINRPVYNDNNISFSINQNNNLFNPAHHMGIRNQINYPIQNHGLFGDPNLT